MLTPAVRRLVAAATTGLVALALAPAADAATVTACVKTKTGDVKIRSGAAAKKRCPKGWKKVRWNTAGTQGAKGDPGAPGAAGATGPAGPTIPVKDATGATVGTLVGTFPQSIPFYFVWRDGGIWLYLASGQVYGSSAPSYKTADCTGTPYVEATAGLGAATTALALSGPTRFVERPIVGGALGPARAYKATLATEDVAALQLYRRTSSGVCQADTTFTGSLVALTEIPPPPDFVGPLVPGF